MPRDNRKALRRPENHRVTLIGPRATYGAARIIDLSASGARLALRDAQRPLPNRFTMVLSYVPKITRECAVVWKHGASIGVKFTLGAVERARVRFEDVLEEEREDALQQGNERGP